LNICEFLQSVLITVSIQPHSSAHSGDSSTQRPTLPSWPSIWSFTWRCRPGRPHAHWTDQRHWICPCQPLETGHPTGPWWSDATARAGCAMKTTYYCACTVYLFTLMCFNKPRLDGHCLENWCLFQLF